MASGWTSATLLSLASAAAPAASRPETEAMPAACDEVTVPPSAATVAANPAGTPSPLKRTTQLSAKTAGAATRHNATARKTNFFMESPFVFVRQLLRESVPSAAARLSRLEGEILGLCVPTSPWVCLYR